MRSRDGRLRPSYYASEPSQIVYALRFLPAYYFEYCALAAALFPRVGSFQQVHFLSLGCGLCPDYFAIQHNFNGVPFAYFGADAVDWTAFRLMPKTDSNFARVVMAVEQINEANLHWADVYLFPKSLGDIAEPALKIVAERIAQTPKKRIFFLNSYVTDAFDRGGYTIPFGVVHQTLLNAGFECQDDVRKACGGGSKECALRTIDGNFDFPDEYLLRCTPEEECYGCEAARGPILRNTRMSYAVLEYIKA